MTGKGKVIAVEGKNALIRVIRKSACDACEGKAACEGSLIGECSKSAEVTVLAGNAVRGVVTLYGHADTLCVSSGQKVKKGDLIARVGTTGQSTGNHLHYTIYEGGTAINPMTYY